MEFVKMSKKGQLVVPTTLRKHLGLEPEDRFIAYGEKDYIIFKKVLLPALKKEFEELVKVSSKISSVSGMTEAIALEEVQSHRKNKKAS